MTSIRPDGRVEFRFFRTNASDVKVLGTFNLWVGDSLTMQHEGDGWWSVIAELEPGEYRFRYLVDGEWFTDYASYGVELARHGWNSVLVVSEHVTEQMCGRDSDVDGEARINSGRSPRQMMKSAA